MKALFIPHSAKEKISIILTLFTLTFWIYPEISLASSLQSEGQNTALVFEIKNPSKLIAEFPNSQENQKGLTYNQIIQSDPLTSKLEEYLKAHNSPLAEYAAEIPQYPQWQRALAVSWVESNFGRFCHSNNCSGIGVKPGHPSWRVYPTKLAWFEDMCKLLEKPIYKERFNTFEKMKGVYVQPGSQAWVYGAKTKYAQLMALTAEAEEERLSLTKTPKETALTTFPELAIN